MLFKVLFDEDGDMFIIGYEHGHWYKPICILTPGDVEHLSTLAHLAEIGGHDDRTNKDV